MTLRERDGAYVPDRLLRASDLAAPAARSENARVEAGRCSTRATGEPVVPNGSIGHRYGEPRAAGT